MNETIKEYRVMIPECDNSLVELISRELDADPIAAQVLARRFGSVERAKEWVSPKFAAPHPFVWTWASSLVEQAEGKRIGLIASTEVDGVCAAAIVGLALGSTARAIDVAFLGDSALPSEQMEQVAALGTTSDLLVFLDTGAHLIPHLNRAKLPPAFILDHQVVLNEEVPGENLFVLNAAPLGIRASTSGMAYWVGEAAIEMGSVEVRRGRKRSTDVDPRNYWLSLAAIGTIADGGRARYAYNHALLKKSAPLFDQIASIHPAYVTLGAHTRRAMGGRPLSMKDIYWELLPFFSTVASMGYGKLLYRLLVSEDKEEAQKASMQLITLDGARRQFVENARQVILKERLEFGGGVSLYARNDPIFHPSVLGVVATHARNVFSAEAALVSSPDPESGMARAVLRTIPYLNAGDLMREVIGHVQTGVARESHATMLIPIESLPEVVHRLEEGIRLRSPNQTQSNVMTWAADAVIDASESLLLHKVKYDLLGPFVPDDATWRYPRILVTNVNNLDFLGDRQLKWDVAPQSAGDKPARPVGISARIGDNFYASPRRGSNRAIMLLLTPSLVATGEFDADADVFRMSAPRPLRGLNKSQSDSPSHAL